MAETRWASTNEKTYLLGFILLLATDQLAKGRGWNGQLFTNPAIELLANIDGHPAVRGSQLPGQTAMWISVGKQVGNGYTHDNHAE